jgi:hypothetical protein
MSLLQPPYVGVAKVLSVANEQTVAAYEHAMAKKNQTVEKICLLFVVLAKEPCLANEQVVAA